MKKKICLIFMFIFVVISFSSIVDGKYECLKETDYTNSDVMKEIKEKSKIMEEFEIETLRTESEKHIKLKDNTIKLISFNKAVHEKRNGVWVDIDNTLSERENYYLNNNSKILLNKNPKDYLLKYDDLKLSVLNCNDCTFEIENNEVDLSSEINYKNLIENVDLNIKFSYNDIYLNIDLNVLKNLKDLIFIINKSDYSISLNENCNLKISNNDFSYIINAPVIYSNENILINYELQDNDNEYYISFDFDDTYDSLIDVNTELICTSANYMLNNSSLQDTYVTSSDPSTVKGSDSRMIAYNGNYKFSLVKTNLPTLPTNSTIDRAILLVPYYFYENTNSYVDVGCYRISSSWSESTATWNNKPSVSSTLIDSKTAYSNNVSSSNPGTLDFDITDYVDDWYTTRLNNYGVALKYINGTYNEIRFKTKESVSYRTILNVYYTIDDLVVSEDTYFIKNGHLDKYMQVDDEDSNNNYCSNGAKLEVWDFDGNDYQEWNFIYLHNGFYKIINKKSNMALAVEEGYENIGLHHLIQETYSGSRRQQWKITVTSHNLYKIKPRSSIDYSNDWVMCIGEGIGGNGRNVEQRNYTNNNDFKDEWILLRNNVDVRLLAYNDGNVNRGEYFTLTSSYISTTRSSDIETLNFTNLTDNEILYYLNTSKILYIHTHGAYNCISLGNNSIYINDFNSIDLSNLELVLLLTCNNGQGGYNYNNYLNNTPTNIVEALVCRGAETVIGFSEETYVSDCNLFAKKFSEQTMVFEKNVYDAICDIDYSDFIKNMDEIAVIGGNIYNYIY